jgi:hypothetical protein
MTSVIDTYIEFMALRHHFNSDYDYIKYSGNVKFNWREADNFAKRKDFFQWQKLSKKTDLQNFILANIIQKPKIWIFELNSSEESEKNYIEWKKRKESFSYVLSEEIKQFDSDVFKNIPINFYNFLKCYSSHLISFETLYVLYMLLNVYGITFMADDPLLNDIEFKLKKYKPFMEKNFLTDEIKILNIAIKRFGSPF